MPLIINDCFFSDVMHSKGNPMVNVRNLSPLYATQTECPLLSVKAQNAGSIGLIRLMEVAA